MEPSFLLIHIEGSTFHHLANQTIRQSDIRPEACVASFQTKRTQNICMLSYFLTYSILLSTICCADGPPFSPERETFCMLSVNQLQHTYLLQKRIFRFTPAICKDCTVPSRRFAEQGQSLVLAGYQSTESKSVWISYKWQPGLLKSLKL